MTKEKALYQVKLILDAMDENDLKKIPKETIDYIEQNMQYDENIKFDATIPLEEQNIDDYACDFLEKLINDIEENERQQEVLKKQTYNSNNDLSVENLKNLIEKLRTENNKIPQMRELLSKYKAELESKNIEITNLKKKNEQLYAEIEKVPKLFRKIFLGNLEKKLLN